MEKALLINPFGIGDVLFTTPVIKAIKNNMSGVFLGYWCNERVKPILENNPYIDKIFALSRGDIKRICRKSKLGGINRFLKLLRDIKSEHFNISLDFSLDHRYSLISKLMGIKRRIGFNYKGRGRFLTDKIDTDSYQDKHVAEYYLSILRPLDINPLNNRLELVIAEQDKRQAEDLLGEAGISSKDLVIGIAPGAGASWGRDASFKHWPAIKFAQLADKIIADFGAKILILGDEQERPIADTVVNTMNNKAVTLAGKTSLAQLCAMINNLRLLVTNDGGPLHIAVALGIKTVSIFGPVDDIVYGPYPPSSNHAVIKKNITCRPCYRRFRIPRCMRNRECINSIDVEEVFSAVRSLL